MKSFFEICYALTRITGIPYLTRKIVASNKVSIIFYHCPEVKTFEEHLKYLSQRYNLISLSQLSEAIYSKNWDIIPKYALVITFDDGWKDNYQLVDVFKKYKFRPTIFLTSHLINTERNFWWTVCSKKEEIQRLKKLTNKQRLTVLKETYSFFPQKEFNGNRQALSLSEIQYMKDFVDFGIHTCFHPILTKCTYKEKRFEIGKSLIRIRKLLGITLNDFAYPNGSYDEDCIKILKEFGIKTARTIDAGWNDKTTDPFKLKITGVSDNGSVNKLAVELTGIPMIINYLVKR